jgi:hypothetical protein
VDKREGGKQADIGAEVEHDVIGRRHRIFMPQQILVNTIAEMRLTSLRRRRRDSY